MVHIHIKLLVIIKTGGKDIDNFFLIDGAQSFFSVFTVVLLVKTFITMSKTRRCVHNNSDFHPEGDESTLHPLLLFVIMSSCNHLHLDWTTGWPKHCHTSDLLRFSIRMSWFCWTCVTSSTLPCFEQDNFCMPPTVEASRSHSDTPYSVRVLWTSDRPVAQTLYPTTRQHTTLTRDRHLCPRRDSNPQSQ